MYDLKPLSENEKEIMSYALIEAEAVIGKDVDAAAEDESIEKMLDEIPEAELEPITAEDLKEIEGEPEPSMDDLLESIQEATLV